ncbi:MAG: DNA repair protein [Anaeroplasmataceae bacterium]
MDIICIDLKSFYASVECVERGLDPFTTPLVVADNRRGNGTVTLAITPYLKRQGVKSRCRLYEIDKKVKYMCVIPRMKKYIEYSANIYKLYLSFFSKDDIYVYSIDEVFIDVTSYLKLYNKTSIEMGKMVIDEIYNSFKLTATCGVGTNLYLAKIAMDILAKHSPTNIAYLDNNLFIEKMHEHKPLTDFWQIGPGTQKRLADLGIYDMKGIANCRHDVLYKAFGINAKNLIDHAYGNEETKMSDIKEYVPKVKSLSKGQTFHRDYTKDQCETILKEMVEAECVSLAYKNLTVKGIGFSILYSNKYDATPFTTRFNLSKFTNSYEYIIELLLDSYNKNILTLPIRKINIVFYNINFKGFEEYDLFTDTTRLLKEKNLLKTMGDIKMKHGSSSIFRALSKTEDATLIERNKYVGGHNGE